MAELLTHISLSHRYLTLQNLVNLVQKMSILFRRTTVTGFPLITKRFASESNVRLVIPSHNFIKKQTEYKQIPDDSRLIETHYDELKEFRDYISKASGGEYTSFSDFEKDPNLFLAEVERWIQTKIYPNFRGQNLGSVLAIKKYNELLRSFKVTLLLNGGHTFIFDLLMSGKEALEKFDDKK